MAETKETVILDFQVDETEAVLSIENLTKANKALREERNKLNLTTKEGAARAAEINAQIDKNTNVIKKNSSALEQQRLNVGNYTKSIKDAATELTNMTGGLNQMIPGLSSVTQGINIMGKSTKDLTGASKLLMVTGIGLLITALGSLIAYFRGSEEGQNKLNKIMTIGQIIAEKITDVFEYLGGAMVDAFENPKKAISDFWEALKTNVWNRITGLIELIPKLGQAISLVFEGKFSEAGKVAIDAVAKVGLGVENVTDKVTNLFNEIVKTSTEAINAATKMADLQAAIDKESRRLTVDRARTQLEVAKLRNDALKVEGQLKIDMISEAIKLEEELSNKEVATAKKRLELAQMNVDIKGDDKEALNELATAEAAYLQAVTLRYTETFKLQKELQNLREEEQKRIEGLFGKEVEKNQEEVGKNLKDFWGGVFKEIAKKGEENKEKEDKWKKREIEAEKIKQKTITGLLQQGLGERVNAQQLYTTLFKKGAAAETMANTHAAAIAAYKSLASIPIIGPVLGALAGAAAYAYGLQQVTGINALTFAAGGGSFYTKGPQLLMVGDNPGGVERVDVTPVSGKGKTVVGKNMIAMAGGGTMYTDAAMMANSRQPSQQTMQPVTVNMVYSEYRDFENMVRFKEKIATA